MRAARIRRVGRHAPAAIVLVVAGAVLLSVGVLAAVHVDDRYGVGAAAGVWMGLSSALRDGVFYPAVYANGFYGGTRYMPLPFILEAGAAAMSNELLASAKLLIYAVAGGLYTLLYWVARRRGAPLPIALGLVGAVLATAAGLTTALGIRWDALATLFQLAAVAVTVNHERSQRRAALSGLLCALALATKISALWAPVALVLWLAVVARRSLGSFLASFVGSCVALAILFETLSSGRLFQNMRLFAFGGSDSAPALEGVHRLYQFALRDQREGAILILAAAVGVVIAALRRRAGPYEIGFVASILVLLVVMRDGGAYENHLLDLLVLTAAVVAGMWTSFAAGRARQLVQSLVIVSILLGTLLAVRYTIVPDMRAALTHELRGKTDDRFAADALAGSPALNGCELFEDASIPLLAGKRPIVLDAFILHRLQTRRPAALALIDDRVKQRSFDRIVLARPLTDVGWFAVLDFGSRIAQTMRDNYKFADHIESRNLWIYVPRRPPSAPTACRPLTVSQW
jgi:hypothetical protein